MAFIYITVDWGHAASNYASVGGAPEAYTVVVVVCVCVCDSIITLCAYAQQG